MTMNAINEALNNMNAQTMVMGNCIFLVKSNAQARQYLANNCVVRENGCYTFNGFIVR